MMKNTHIVCLLAAMLFSPSCTSSKKKKKYSSIEKKIVEKKVQERKKKMSGPVGIHKAHLSEGWYPKTKGLLEHEVKRYFEQSIRDFYVEAHHEKVRALIVPHAGYHYSGLCAATAYQTLLSTKNLYSRELKNKHIKRVIVLAPSHRRAFRGVALPDFSTYRTVLGDVEIDEKSYQLLSKNSLFKVLPLVFEKEHAFEIQLPFLQQAIDDFTVVPLIVGHLEEGHLASIARSLEAIRDDKTLIVISSDFMHHGSNFDYNVFDEHILRQVRFIDSLAVEAIADKSFTAFQKVLEETGTTICGQNPIRIFLKMLENQSMKRLQPRVSCYYTSAHLAQARKESGSIDTRVLLGNVADEASHGSVSYVGMVFADQDFSKLSRENQLTGFEKRALLTLARDAVANKLESGSKQVKEHLLWPVLTPGIKKRTGAFVTINTNQGKLRGCIGSIMAHDPLYQTVLAMGKAAAFTDKRFSPLKKDELDKVVFDVSILTRPEKISSMHEIVLGKHGIILSKFKKDGSLETSSVFLPQVPPSFGWDIIKTMQQLSVKAGLGPDGWKSGCELQVFQGIEIKEK